MLRSSDKRLITRITLDLFLLVAIYGIALMPSLNGDYILPSPKHFFKFNSAELYYPYKPSILNKLHIAVLTTATPAVCILLVEGLREIFERRLRRPYFMYRKLRIPCFFSECYKLLGIYFFGLALTFIVTRFTKYQLRQLRPHFHALCEPKFYTSWDGLNQSNDDVFPHIIDSYICTSKNATTDMLWSLDKSMPSLYVTLGSYAMSFMVLYLHVRFCCNGLRLYRLVVQLICLGVVLAIAAERLITNSSHVRDVVAGGVLGMLMATFAAHAVAQIFVEPRFKSRKPADSVNEFIISSVFNVRNSTSPFLNATFDRNESESFADRPTSSIIYDSVC